MNRKVPQLLFDGTSWYLYGGARIARVNGSGTVFYHHDIPGSVRAISKYNSGTGKVEIVAKYNYEAFGKLRTSTGSAMGDNDMGFAGEQRDSETGNYYLRARYYDGDTGRFLAADPVAGSAGSPQSLNPFAYVTNNPVNAVDPTGMVKWCLGGCDSNGNVIHLDSQGNRRSGERNRGNEGRRKRVQSASEPAESGAAPSAHQTCVRNAWLGREDEQDGAGNWVESDYGFWGVSVKCTAIVNISMSGALYFWNRAINQLQFRDMSGGPGALEFVD